MPAEKRSGKICCAEDVEATRQDAAGNSVKGGANPCYLGFVYSEVGRYRAVPALSGEYVVGFC